MYSMILTAFLAVAALNVDVAPGPDIVTLSDSEATVSDGDAVLASPFVDVSILTTTLESIDENLAIMAFDASVDAYQVSDYYVEYFKGVLQNMPYTEYLCYAERVYTDNRNYITHYYLMYDLNVSSGKVASGSYPCLDVYNYNGVYYMMETEKEFVGYPTIGYASFFPYSALIDRSFNYSYFFLLAVGVSIFFLIARKTVFS